MLPRACVVVVVVVSMIAGTAIHCYSQDSSEENITMTMQGKVVAIDWVGSTITVDDMTFSIPSNVKVVKGMVNIDFSDINVGDRVTITYNKEKDESSKASKIIVAYSGDFPI